MSEHPGQDGAGAPAERRPRAPKVYYGLDAIAYRDAPGLAHSDSKRLRKSPYHYHEVTLDPQPKAPTPQQAMGSMVHVATLEPDHFDARYIVGPNVNKNSSAWKQFADGVAERGALPITQDAKDLAFAMAASARAVPDFNMLLEGCATEVSLWWDCPKTGVRCKARPDLVRRYPPLDASIPAPEGTDPAREALMREKGFAILADLKTTESADAESFSRSVADYSYHTQAQWYIEGAEIALGVPVLSFLFVVVEREFPYAACSYTLDDNAMKVAADLNLQARALYAQCLRDNIWPGYPAETRDISLPGWYMKRYLQGLPA